MPVSIPLPAVVYGLLLLPTLDKNGGHFGSVVHDARCRAPRPRAPASGRAPAGRIPAKRTPLPPSCGRVIFPMLNSSCTCCTASTTTSSSRQQMQVRNPFPAPARLQAHAPRTRARVPATRTRLTRPRRPSPPGARPSLRHTRLSLPSSLHPEVLRTNPHELNETLLDRLASISPSTRHRLATNPSPTRRDDTPLRVTARTTTRRRHPRLGPRLGACIAAPFITFFALAPAVVPSRLAPRAATSLGTGRHDTAPPPHTPTAAPVIAVRTYSYSAGIVYYLEYIRHARAQILVPKRQYVQIFVRVI